MVQKKKKSQSKVNSGNEQLKSELLKSIGEMFKESNLRIEDLRADTKQSIEGLQKGTSQRIQEVRKDMINSVGEMFMDQNEKIVATNRELRVLIEQVDRKVTEAMLPSQMTFDHDLKIKEHDGRIGHLERDIGVVKTAISSKSP